ILMVDIHHIVTDGISQGVLINDFIDLYQGRNLPGLRIQYKCFSQWQNQDQESIKKYEAYWLKEFRDEFPLLNLPVDFVRPPIQSFDGTTVDFTLEAEETGALKKIAIKENATLFMVLLAIYNIFLSKISSQEDIIIGTPVSGRGHPDLQRVMGMFVNTLVLRNYPEGNKTFIEFLKQLKERALSAFENQDYPFEDLVERVVKERDQARNPVFDAAFALQNMDIPKIEIPGLTLTPFPFKHNIAKFDLTLNSTEIGDKLFFNLEYCTKLFKAQTVEQWINYFKTIVCTVIEEPAIRLADLEIITGEEKARVLYEFNDTVTAYPGDKTIGQLFQDQAQRTADNIAVVGACESPGGTGGPAPLYITYKELNQQAGQLAQLLIEKGVQTDMIVAIMVERSIETIIGILGILKAGGAYLPIDPDFPPGRINYMVSDSVAGFRVIGRNLTALPSTPRHPTPGPAACLAYVMYTSGSTGKPKGVMVDQKSVVRLVKHTNYTDIHPHDHILQLSNITFDGSVFDIYGALLNGAVLYMVLKEVLLSNEKLTAFIGKHHINITFITTALFNSLLDLSPRITACFDKIYFGGETASIRHVKMALENQKSPGSIVHVYGPTEGTTFSTYYPVTSLKRNASTVPIGAPISNTRVYILDKHRRFVPVGIVGELFIAGDGLARGYLNHPELTAEKFDHDKKTKSFCGGSRGAVFSKSAPLAARGKLYQTGDLARWLPDGNVDFLGRIDHQVKIRGFRIEPGEIENHLIKMDEIKEATVLVKEDEKGEHYLCAYVVPHTKLRVSQIKDFLQQRLPAYMIPSYFILLEQIPLNPNGKVDKKALPEPDRKEPGQDYIAPRNRVEKKLVKIWSEVLGVERDKISINTNFFEWGGHSLKVTSMVSKIHKELNVKIPFVEAFTNPTVTALARYIKEKGSQDKYKSIEPTEKKEYYTLSSPQRRFYLLQQVNMGNTTYNMSQTLDLGPTFDEKRLAVIFKKLTRRHESLRTSFKIIENKPRQIIHQEVDFKIDYYQVPGENWENITADFIKPFDLSIPPLFRVGLINTGNEKILVVDIHHIISDGISLQVLTKEFISLYEGKPLPPLPVQYKDYASWQDNLLKNNLYKKMEKFWLDALENFNITKLPEDSIAYQGHSGGHPEIAVIENNTYLSIEEFCSKYNLTKFSFMFSVFAFVLNKETDQNDITIGTPTANRDHFDIENIIGVFLNVILLRAVIDEEDTVINNLLKINKDVKEALENSAYPYEELHYQVGKYYNLTNDELFTILFNYLPGEKKKTTSAPFEINPKYNVTLYITDTNEEMVLNMVYRNNLYSRERMKRIITNYFKLIDAVISNENIITSALIYEDIGISDPLEEFAGDFEEEDFFK
ncbi:MAG: amino acid adenylation domain-containing protein, partial [Candidatus Aminicenantes bacterium]